MPRKPHPADLADANAIATAVRFDIALFLGTGRYATATASTIELARSEASRLAALHPNGRSPLIYGISADGRSGLIIDPKKEHAMSKPVNKNRVLVAPKKLSRKKPAAKKGAAKKAAAAKKPAKVVAKKGKKAAAAAPANGAKLGKRAAILAAARQGMIPDMPDFSANTHARFRGKLDEVVSLVKARDLKGLRKFHINPVSSSPKAIAKYRDLSILALEALEAM